MSEFSRAVRVKAPVQVAYDHCVGYFQSLGYLVGRTVPPARVEMRKKGAFWTIDEIDASHKLTIYLTPEGEDVIINFAFYCSAGLGGFTEHSVRSIDFEISNLVGLIMKSVPQEKDRVCVECNKGIPWDAKLCPYCGHDYGGMLKGG